MKKKTEKVKKLVLAKETLREAVGGNIEIACNVPVATGMSCRCNEDPVQGDPARRPH
jgi:hypothetical protein